MLIAIDGPSGAGKGTVARAVAESLQCRHVDTGAMYRAVAWRAVDLGVDLEDEDAVATVARESALTAEQGRVVIDGIDVTRAIRTPEMDAAAARVARLPRVREVLVERQRAYAANGDLVMEGRDIGTVVLPQADVKVYLDADAEERARRRAGDVAHAAQGGMSRPLRRPSRAATRSTGVARCRRSPKRPTPPTSIRPASRSGRSWRRSWRSSRPPAPAPERAAASEGRMAIGASSGSSTPAPDSASTRL